MNWLQKTAEDLFDLRKDGKFIFRGTQNECYMKMQTLTVQSFDMALKYEGWTISPMNEDWRDHYNWYAPE